MASYIDYDDFPSVIQGKLARWGVPATPTATRDAEIAKHETKVQSLINSKLIRCYPAEVPFTAATLPNLVKYQIALPLVIFSIAGDQQDVALSYRTQAEKAEKLLDQIMAREIDIYSESASGVLSTHTSDMGFETDTDDDYVEEEYRDFPRPVGDLPSSIEYEINSDH